MIVFFRKSPFQKQNKQKVTEFSGQSIAKTKKHVEHMFEEKVQQSETFQEQLQEPLLEVKAPGARQAETRQELLQQELWAQGQGRGGGSGGRGRKEEWEEDECAESEEEQRWQGTKVGQKDGQWSHGR